MGVVMKSLLSKLLFRFAVLSLLGVQLCSLKAESSDDAKKFLIDHPPLLQPAIDLHLKDDAKREHSISLFNAQMERLRELSSCKDADVVRILIPFLNYSTVEVLPYFDSQIDPNSIDIRKLIVERPALAAIVAAPNFKEQLVDYAVDSKNSLQCRFAAYHLLRYLDAPGFDKVSEVFDKQLVKAGPLTKAFYQAIKDGSLGFEGINTGEFQDANQ